MLFFEIVQGTARELHCLGSNDWCQLGHLSHKAILGLTKTNKKTFRKSGALALEAKTAKQDASRWTAVC